MYQEITSLNLVHHAIKINSILEFCSKSLIFNQNLSCTLVSHCRSSCHTYLQFLSMILIFLFIQLWISLYFSIEPPSVQLSPPSQRFSVHPTPLPTTPLIPITPQAPTKIIHQRPLINWLMQTTYCIHIHLPFNRNSEASSHLASVPAVPVRRAASLTWMLTWHRLRSTMPPATRPKSASTRSGLTRRSFAPPSGASTC